MRKKFRLIADTSAVTRAAARPPSSARMIVKARNTNARFDAAVSVRSGISTMPSTNDPAAPATIQTRTSSSPLMTDPPRYVRNASTATPRIASSFQEVGHIGHDDVPAKQQGALDEQRGLVVQHVLPPPPWKELREHDRHHPIVAQRLD